MSSEFWNNIATITTPIITLIIGFFAWKINDKLKQIQDVVEIHGSLWVEMYENENGSKTYASYIRIQNVGTRII